jgi:hypothetical protein
MRSLTKAAVLIVAFTTMAAGCGGGAIVPDGPVNLDKLRRSTIPVYYVGEAFAGFNLTYADTRGNGALLAYGTCKTTSDGGCSPPMEIQSCAGSDVVSLFGGRDLAARVAAALRPFNDAARKLGAPTVKMNTGLGCPA